MVDTGLRNAFLGKRPSDVGHVLENAVFMELLRRGFEVTVGKIDKVEIDFVAVNHTDRVYVQVCRTLADEKVERVLAFARRRGRLSEIRFEHGSNRLLSRGRASPEHRRFPDGRFFVLERRLSKRDHGGVLGGDGLLKGAFRLAKPCCISREASRGIRFLSEISADAMLGTPRARQLRRGMLIRFASRWSVR